MIVRTESPGDPDANQDYQAGEQGTCPEIPLAVLINGGTASAAEVLAACLQDHDRAALVGQRSFGRGIIQSIVQLKSGGGLRLTAAKIVRPNGDFIHRFNDAEDSDEWGVRPDSGLERRFTDEELSRFREDRQHRGDRLRLRGRASRAVTADLRDTPDAFPALAVVACSTSPGSVLTGLEHLKHKESDRLSVMVDNLRRLGAEVEVGADSLRVLRPIARELRQSSVQVTSAGDHRIAMAMAVAGLVAGPLHLDDVACVHKSFPTFWDQWRRLAGGRPVEVS